MKYFYLFNFGTFGIPYAGDPITFVGIMTVNTSRYV